MTIVNHDQVPNTPWRPGQRRKVIAGRDQGLKELSLFWTEVKPGTGAPLHYHEVEEILIILGGAVEARLDQERQHTPSNHSIVIPARTPHAFTVVGEEPATIMAVFSHPEPFLEGRTTYLEGTPPAEYSPAS